MTSGLVAPEILPGYEASMTFLDSDPQLGASEHASLRGIRRPWMDYWPPSPGDTLHDWLKAECPAVLSWRWNPDKPFDRPWQKWSQEARKSGKSRPSIVMPAHTATAAPSEVNELGLIPDEIGDRKVAKDVSALDQQIQEWALSTVKPKAFNYLALDRLHQTEKPYHSRLPFLEGLPRTNIVGQSFDTVRIHDITGVEEHFVLAVSGFEFCQIPPAIHTWNEQTVRDQYLPSMGAWLREKFNSKKFRSLDPERKPSEAWIPPFTRAHCDVTPKSGKSRLKLHLPGEADEFLKGRMWRALSGPYQDNTLAVCDSRTVAIKDLVPADILFPHYCDEGYEVTHNVNHRWFYKRNMGIDDVIVFKHYDSIDTEASFCPHAAFVDHTVPPNTPPRASIELRAIVID
ncbi:hypothetical protein COCVIDRAFT_28091 [Bipolaris victoriae FI3]|uniref:Uncharacterized protein n=1 Tax=Bipolaris victoriae (strain FI3) TaxID=930091 RepID=W7EAY9_BIPV3|nr:hypothetical protein COCVIDRAFT_28091 [Bipolaris victoriae FI3]